MGSSGLDILVAAREATGLPIVSELMDAQYLDEFIEKVDVIQIGARNMQNFDLLKKVGAATKKPILLKRGLSATYEEWIMSAEYIMAMKNGSCQQSISWPVEIQMSSCVKEGSEHLNHIPEIHWICRPYQ